MQERTYQSILIRKLQDILPGCLVLKNDSDYVQGIPDLLVLYKDRWAMLEVKASANSSIQPNQEFWVSELDSMSFASFIFPENEEEVLDALQSAFKSRRATRLLKR